MYFSILFAAFPFLIIRSLAAPVRLITRDPSITTKLNIVAVGASITFGTDSTDGYGYRKTVLKALERAGNEVHMVGTQSHGNGDNTMNEGYPGRVISAVSNSIQNTWKFLRNDDGVTGYTPNVIITLVGTNDCDTGRNSLAAITDAPNRYNAYLDKLRALCPTCVIVVSSLPPNRNPLWNQNIDFLNWYIQDSISKRFAAGEKILFSDGNTGLSVQNDISSVDGIHPNDGGYKIIGARIAAQIQSAVNGGWITAPADF